MSDDEAEHARFLAMVLEYDEALVALHAGAVPAGQVTPLARAIWRWGTARVVRRPAGGAGPDL